MKEVTIAVQLIVLKELSIQDKKRKTGLDEALEDVAAGRVSHYDSVEDFFKEMGL